MAGPAAQRLFTKFQLQWMYSIMINLHSHDNTALVLSRIVAGILFNVSVRNDQTISIRTCKMFGQSVT